MADSTGAQVAGLLRLAHSRARGNGLRSRDDHWLNNGTRAARRGGLDLSSNHRLDNLDRSRSSYGAATGASVVLLGGGRLRNRGDNTALTANLSCLGLSEHQALIPSQLLSGDLLADRRGNLSGGDLSRAGTASGCAGRRARLRLGFASVTDLDIDVAFTTLGSRRDTSGQERKREDVH